MNDKYNLKDNSCLIYSKKNIEDQDYNYYIIKNEITGKDIWNYIFNYRNLTDIVIKKIFIKEIKDFNYDVLLLFKGKVER